ncbi:hypothetical protein [Bdellovibrio sp. HCB-162]|uniref:hypothetical protein n=1 Tax=Bdellovibrio sp. HCB-162 TaxID=3394234 RepID=UPI0039BD127F
MKTAYIFSALLISSALLTSACTPQDKAVVDKNLRATIQQQNARKAGKGGGATQRNPNQFSLTDYGLSAFLIERQIEAVELVKLATGSLDATKTQYALEKLADNDKGLKQAKITAAKENLEYATEDGAWKTKASKSLDVTHGELNGDLGVEIKAAGLKYSVDTADKNKKRFYVNLVDNVYELALVPSKDNKDAYELVVKIEGSLGGAKGAGNVNNKISMDLAMTIDKASLQTSEVKILSMNSSMKYPGSNDRVFNSGVSGANVTMKIEGLCSELIGKVKGSAGPKKTYDVVAGNEQIQIKNEIRKLVTCGKRPTLDLSRLLNF